FAVERALAGEPVKEALIGVEVFGRPADYDPRVDPIVRVEARRLRSRLAAYYQGPGAGDPVIIDLPKGGYVPVFASRGEEGPVPATPGPAGDTAGKRARTAFLLIAAGVLMAAVMFFASRSREPPRPVVAVLPFVNMSDDKSNEYFGEGLTEELIDRLAKAPGLRVVARSSAFQFQGRSQDLREIGKKLNATAVVEGSVRRSGDRLRVTAQLIDVDDGLHLWSETYERTMSDVFAIQDDISRSIANALRAELRVGFASQPSPPTTNVEAYELYLKGRRHLNHDALAGLELAAGDFERAIVADPQFAGAQALLALDYGLLGYYQLRAAGEVWPKATRTALKAISLDSRLGAGHAALGFALALYEWKWAEAERSLRKAIELDPNSAEAHVGLAVGALVPTGRLAEASAELARAQELDPQSYLATVGGAFAFLADGRYDDAIAQYRRATELNPSHADTQWDLGMAYAFAGQKEAAAKQFQLAGRIQSGGSWQPGPMEAAMLGDAAEAHRRIAAWPEFKKHRPIFVAYCYGMLGEAGEAAAWLEKAVEARDPQAAWIKIDPRLRTVRGDAKIAALIRKVGL
ncbi:MAG: tetratricopeptide repeat protein, partial [Acidobacteriia bacterium]|nr:tetratricopeptide repeat protein [Terriglobia bacterium]